MWKAVGRALQRAWRWARQTSSERKASRARARFWAELREGQREADARSRS